MYTLYALNSRSPFLPPQPWQPLVYFLSMDLSALDISYIWNQYMTFHVCFHVSSRLICVVACVRTPFPYVTE